MSVRCGWRWCCGGGGVYAKNTILFFTIIHSKFFVFFYLRWTDDQIRCHCHIFPLCYIVGMLQISKVFRNRTMTHFQLEKWSFEEVKRVQLNVFSQRVLKWSSHTKKNPLYFANVEVFVDLRFPSQSGAKSHLVS